MKKIIGFLGLGLALLAMPVHAAEVKVRGYYDISTYWINESFSGPSGGSFFGANQRLQTTIEIIASQSLKGVLTLRTDADWGTQANYNDNSFGGSMGTDGISVKVRESYVHWTPPNTHLTLRMGLQYMQFPGEVAGSAIFGSGAAAAIANYQVNETVGLGLWWMRPENDNSINKRSDAMDLVGLNVPLTFEGLSITPWVAYGRIGKNTFAQDLGQPQSQLYPFLWEGGAKPGNSSIWWAALTANLSKYNPFTLAVDLNYGQQHSGHSEFNRQGWYGALIAQYDLEPITPGLLFWYASGDDSNIHNGSERMPTLDAYWTGTSMGFDDYWQERGTGASVAGNDPTGTWGIAAQVLDVSFLEDITHNFRLAWYMGTNSKHMANAYTQMAPSRSLPSNGYLTPQGLYLTTKDHVWEANINSFWKIYQNLTFGLELGYMNLNLDKDLWQLSSVNKNAYRFMGTFRYSF